MRIAFLSLLLASAACALPAATTAGPANNLAFDSPIVNHPYLAVKRPSAPAKQHSFAAAAAAPDASFHHGVASGDPLSDAVILWTKVTSNASEVSVSYQVAADAAFATIVSAGTVATNADVDFTVKLDITGLLPATTYFYRFTSGASVSPTGKTHTIPTADTDLASYKLAVVSCSNLPAGFFNAYAAIAKRTDVDLVLHVGDYIYEYQNGKYGDGTSMGRIPQPNVELSTLSDYRTRHAQYKTDVDLQAAHLAYPWVTVWDDHEFADDSWIGGAEGTKPGLPGPWEPRKLAAMRAYFEYMPIRAALIDGVGKIYRNFQVGKLFDLTMLDTRMSGREKTDIKDSSIVNAPNRTIMGFPQEKWFNDQLSASKARGAQWRMVGNQVTFAPTRVLFDSIMVLPPDSWDDYPANRKRVMDYITGNQIQNVVMLTGDIHTGLAFDVPYSSTKYTRSSGKGSALVEFVGASVTSDGMSFLQSTALYVALPHLKYANGRKHGYMLVSIDKQRVNTEWHVMSTIAARDFSDKVDAVMETASGSGHITYKHISIF
ncbi:hypothetical protein HDU87_006648 [Geranomyces variabilis]|uniref:Alkaline phosphatase D n=1 Tax=Geranomyces variabilis TaxID=109894 RepID=A0AAD5TFD7_9FUNG|nr:hypothetical protein HDU87_006648 [Geranomyces variabilis]